MAKIFKVEYYDSKTNARLGILKINGKKLTTPTLWLGSLINTHPFPWKYFKVDNIMVNSYEILTNGIQKQKLNRNQKIHDILDMKGLVMMDSGGFQLQKANNLEISPVKILEIYKEMKPDLAVVLDHPLTTSFSEIKENHERWRKTLKNTEFMLNNCKKIHLVPVVHGYTVEDIRKACKEIKEIANPNIIGIGSLVPVIKPWRSSSISRLNGVDSKSFMINAIRIVREEFPDAMLHVFGVGSVSTMHCMFSLGVDSVDSIGWRMKAAYGAIQLPGIGDRFISPKKKRRKLSKKEEEILKKCNCPICNGKTLKERKQALDNKFSSTFYNRAIHNAWIFYQENILAKKMIKRGEYYNFIKCRLDNTIFKKYILISS